MKCVQCTGRSQLPLCKRCVAQLGELLDDLDWLIGQLEITATRQDRLTVGMSRAFGHPMPANHPACELLRDVGAELGRVAAALSPTLGPLAPRLTVWWLRQRLDALAGLSDADRHYRTVAHWAGFPSPIHDLINRPDRRFAGSCPDCKTLCFARHDDVYTTCGECGIPIDVERNRAATIVAHDLLPERALLITLDNLDEHVSRVKLYSWITSGRLPVAGYLSSGGVVSHKGARRDPKVYSLGRARALRYREQTSDLALAPH